LNYGGDVNIEYKTCVKNANYDKVLEFMNKIDLEFTPSLKEKVNIPEYVKKITQKAVIFLALESGGIVGMSAVYYNKFPDYSYGTFLAVLKEYRKREVVFNLQENGLEYLKKHTAKGLKCVVSSNNTVIIKILTYYGYKIFNKFHDEKLGLDRYEMKLDLI